MLIKQIGVLLTFSMCVFFKPAKANVTDTSKLKAEQREIFLYNQIKRVGINTSIFINKFDSCLILKSRNYFHFFLFKDDHLICLQSICFQKQINKKWVKKYQTDTVYKGLKKAFILPDSALIFLTNIKSNHLAADFSLKTLKLETYPFYLEIYFTHFVFLSPKVKRYDELFLYQSSSIFFNGKSLFDIIKFIKIYHNAVLINHNAIKKLGKGNYKFNEYHSSPVFYFDGKFYRDKNDNAKPVLKYPPLFL